MIIDQVAIKVNMNAINILFFFFNMLNNIYKIYIYIYINKNKTKRVMKKVEWC